MHCLERIELKWLVELSIRLSKMQPLQVTASKLHTNAMPPGRKRKAEAVANITALTGEVLARLQLPTNMGIAVRGPAKATRALPTMSADECDEWLANARVAAVAGSCPRSRKEIASGVRAYTAFAVKLRQLALPPSVDMLLAWSNTFRCSRTYTNYVSLLRTACQIAGLPTAGMYDPALKKAVNAIDKRRGYIPRRPMFIQFELVRKLVHNASASPDQAVKALAMAFLMSYIFLLRLPSECLPVRTQASPVSDSLNKAVVEVYSDRIVLRLSRRKNKEGGSVLIRKCWCAACKATCPVHALGKYFQETTPGSSPFGNISASRARTGLRMQLQALGVKDALKYRTHDFRRGHAKDLAKAGSTLREILDAGEWKSASFLQYLDKDELECDAVAEAHWQACIDESSDEDAHLGGQVCQAV